MEETNLKLLQYLQGVYNYDPSTGHLFRKVRTGVRGKAGSIVGGTKGYRYVNVNYGDFDKDVPLHHLVWFFNHGKWPTAHLSFKDKNPSNTKLENLTEQTAQETTLKGKVRSNSRSGVKGISWSETEQKWQVHVYRNYGTKALGSYKDFEEAKRVLEEARTAKVQVLEPTEEEKAAALDKYRRRVLWNRLNRQHKGNHTWFSADQFVDEVGYPINDSYILVPKYTEKLLGPGNFEWRARGNDYNTREGRVEAGRKHYKRNYEKHREYWLQDKFGISIEEYNSKLEQQNGVCDICGRPETAFRKGKLLPLSVDHNHRTNAVRGLLCNACNIGIGALQDNTEILTKAIVYLHKWNCMPVELPNNVVPLKKA